jgi:hypothetical protein
MIDKFIEKIKNVHARQVYCFLAGIFLGLIHIFYGVYTEKTPVFLHEWSWLITTFFFIGFSFIDIRYMSPTRAAILYIATVRTVGMQMSVIVMDLVSVISGFHDMKQWIIERSVLFITCVLYVAHFLPLMLLLVCFLGWHTLWQEITKSAFLHSSKLSLWLNAVSVNCLVLFFNFAYVDNVDIADSDFNTPALLLAMMIISACVQLGLVVYFQ